MTFSCLPSSVEINDSGCCKKCRHLSTVALEGDSAIVRIDQDAFSACSSLKSVYLPASLHFLSGLQFLLCPKVRCGQFQVAMDFRPWHSRWISLLTQFPIRRDLTG
jgi:hypothetical protein